MAVADFCDFFWVWNKMGYFSLVTSSVGTASLPDWTLEYKYSQDEALCNSGLTKDAGGILHNFYFEKFKIDLINFDMACSK